MATEPDNNREKVLRWVRSVTESLEEQARLDAIEYGRLSADERWQLVAAACRGVVARLNERQLASAEAEAEADAKRFGELMREIRRRQQE